MVIIISSIFRAAYPETAFGHSAELIRSSCPPQADWVWRIVLAFGAVPALLTAYARTLMPETPRFTLQVRGDAAQAGADAASVLTGSNGAADEECIEHPRPQARPAKMDTRAFLKAWGKSLLGCSVSWFCLDVAFYSQNLFAKDVFSAIGWLPAADQMGALEETFRIARAQALIALGSCVMRCCRRGSLLVLTSSGSQHRARLLLHRCPDRPRRPAANSMGRLCHDDRFDGCAGRSVPLARVHGQCVADRCSQAPTTASLRRASARS